MAGDLCLEIVSRPVPPELARYSRQVILPRLGVEGQRRLASARVLVLGIGALGTAVASSMVRAGVGHVRLVDRDYIELDNLQRQSLFDEEDIAAGLPKAVAAGRKLRKANSAVRVEAIVADAGPSNIEGFVSDCTLVLDGCDNFEARLLLNDACLKHRVPWIYGAAIGTSGCTFTVLPGDGPCFRCVIAAVPPAGAVETCETAGVLGAVPQAVAAMQAAEAVKLLAGRRHELVRAMRFVDLWEGSFETLALSKGPQPCPACDLGSFEYLEGARKAGSFRVCGRDAVQVDPGPVPAPDFPALAGKLGSLGIVKFNEHMLRFQEGGGLDMTLFPDGRAIIKGASDEAAARAAYARYIGS